MPYSKHLCHSLSFVPSFTKEDSIRVQLSYHHSRAPTYEAVVGWVERLNISGFEACVATSGPIRPSRKGRNWRHSALDNRNSMCGRWFGGKGGSELQIVLTRSNVVMRLLNYVNPIQRWGGGGGGGGAAFEVPLTKKLNNFKAVQAGTTNLSDFSKNSSGNLKFISWSLCQHWCYHGNRVLASTVFSLKNRLYFYFNRWNYYHSLFSVILSKLL